MSLLEEYVSNTPFLQTVATFHDPLAAVQFLSEAGNADLVFLDIQLPELSGLELAKVIPQPVKIIFTTAYADFAVRSYEVNTIDYLLKPITYQRFFQAAVKAKKLFETEKIQKAGTPAQAHFFVKSGKKIVQVNWNDIYYIEALKEYMAIVTVTEKILVYKRMSEFESILPAHFKRVHNSYIINLDRIEQVEDNMVFVNKKPIPVSKSYRDEFYTVIKGRLI
jgi:DNA-binding LytR/AlgR family response regulator